MHKTASVESRRMAIIVRHVAVVPAEVNEDRNRGDKGRAAYDE